MSKNTLNLNIEINLEVSDDIINKILSDSEYVRKFVISNAFRNNTRILDSVDYTIFRHNKIFEERWKKILKKSV